jgi:hypothetical protein
MEKQNSPFMKLRFWRRLGLFGVLGYIPAVASFFLGGDGIYWYTSRATAYGGSHATDINWKFQKPLLNWHPRSSTTTSGMKSYFDEDVDMKILYIRNNNNTKVVAPDDVQLVLCPMPQYFVIWRNDFALKRDDKFGRDCGLVRNVRPIVPANTEMVYFFSEEFPNIMEYSKSSQLLSSGDRMLELQLIIRGIMFLGAVIIILSGTPALATFLSKFLLAAAQSKFSVPRFGVIAVKIVVFGVSLVTIGFATIGPILFLSEYEFAGDYDKPPTILYTGMQLVSPAPSRGQLIDQLERSGKFDDALSLTLAVAADTEKAEIEDIGKPGFATASALNTVSWYQLLAGKYDDALKFANRAIQIAPQEVWIEANRDHAILLSGQVAKARELYLARKGIRIRGQLWEDMIHEDFGQLRKASIESPAYAEIESLLADH